MQLVNHHHSSYTRSAWHRFGTEAPDAANAIDDTELEAILTITGGVDGLNGWRVRVCTSLHPALRPCHLADMALVATSS